MSAEQPPHFHACCNKEAQPLSWESGSLSTRRVGVSHLLENRIRIPVHGITAAIGDVAPGAGGGYRVHRPGRRDRVDKGRLPGACIPWMGWNGREANRHKRCPNINYEPIEGNK